MCSEILDVFDTLIPLQYNEQDRRAGYFFGKDRRGQLHRVPLMTLSIGIVTNRHRQFAHPAQVSELATEMKSYAKTLPGLGVRGRPPAGPTARSGRAGSGSSREDAEMNVTCPNCATVFRVDPAKVPEAGVRARCSVCSAVFAVAGDGRPELRPPRLRAAAAAPAPRPRRAAPPAAAEPPPPARPPAGRRRRPPAAPLPPRAEPPRSGRRPAAPDRRSRRHRRRRRPPPPRSPRPRRAAGAGAAAGLAGTPRPRGRLPAGAAAGSGRAASAAAAGRRPARAAPAGPRPVNPFLSQDPVAQGAAPGARADLRHGRVSPGQAAGRAPGRDAEGALRGGDQEELGGVRRSRWAASSRSRRRYFQEALNEILAGGRQIF